MGGSRSRSAEPSVLDAYPVRIMLGLVASLSLMLALARLPIQTSVSRVGWFAQLSADRIVLSDVGPERPSEEKTTSEKETAAEETPKAPPPTNVRSSRPRQPTKSASAGTPQPESSPGRPEDASERNAEYDDVQSVDALGTTDRKPRVVGGIGSLYLQINYPANARQQGIEGRLVLGFTVETDGTVSDVEVLDSLHPLCDSAAVEGVRSVRFVPAKHDGTPIPVRMRLPVKFKLTSMSRTLSQNGPDP